MGGGGGGKTNWNGRIKHRCVPSFRCWFMKRKRERACSLSRIVVVVCEAFFFCCVAWMFTRSHRVTDSWRRLELSPRFTLPCIENLADSSRTFNRHNSRFSSIFLFFFFFSFLPFFYRHRSNSRFWISSGTMEETCGLEWRFFARENDKTKILSGSIWIGWNNFAGEIIDAGEKEENRHSEF